MIIGKIELGYNAKSRTVMCTVDDIFEGEFIQYEKDQPVPPLCDNTSLYFMSYYHFYFL